MTRTAWRSRRSVPSSKNHTRFPNRTNTEFVEIIDQNHVKMRVWERGSGETLACGTGCCAVCVAGVLNGFTASKLEVQVLGGRLLIEWDPEENLVWMTGPTRLYSGAPCRYKVSEAADPKAAVSNGGDSVQGLTGPKSTIRTAPGQGRQWQKRQEKKTLPGG